MTFSVIPERHKVMGRVAETGKWVQIAPDTYKENKKFLGIPYESTDSFYLYRNKAVQIALREYNTGTYYDEVKVVADFIHEKCWNILGEVCVWHNQRCED